LIQSGKKYVPKWRTRLLNGWCEKKKWALRWDKVNQVLSLFGAECGPVESNDSKQ
jgi:hypothetical protein